MALRGNEWAISKCKHERAPARARERITPRLSARARAPN